MKRISLVGVLSLCCLSFGCENGNVSTSPETQAAPTFQRIQEQVFDVSCSSDSCHSSIGRAADLVLEPGASWDGLINVEPSNPVAAAGGAMRVMPQHPEKSLLMHKLSGNLQAGEGVRMPYGAAPLPSATQEIIEAWIAAGAPSTGLVPGDDGRNLAASGSGGELILDPPTRGLQLRATSPAVPQGKEETGCHYFKLPSDVDLDVNRIQVAVSGGSHHIHLYRPYDRNLDVPDHYEVCNAAVDFDQWALIVAVQLRETDWELPPGVAFHFRAGEQLLMQTHFVNVGSLETQGEGKVRMNLHEAEAGSVQAHAGAMFGQNRDVVVPANSESVLSADCVFPRPLTLIAQTGHYHFRGRRFRTYDWIDGQRGALNYEHFGYDDPAFVVYPFGAEPSYAAGQGLQWECLWENNTPQTYTFGPFTDTNEHCNWFGFYYPTETPDEAITCVRRDGASTTTIRNGR